ncbi:DNA ligase (Polydeoxyribonucleotide synthase [ATP]) [Uncinocarpus reesii 1704]|uniref:DNA ligase n=1 Tax=Uncinocarpus reesii (strain UAMH 1704) TaxID=336963 RepID=C4JDJ8_UNCRE|nr:DNA ligase (Polydeoxyribonucleotide synthase [ATP]) [Uncinocarpus reesii 1704]EEP75911.1 DNA ligase (Polydeoxyribonucleotide synthase [ATP]) [Uncinocarpus reesii 1704]
MAQRSGRKQTTLGYGLERQSPMCYCADVKPIGLYNQSMLTCDLILDIGKFFGGNAVPAPEQKKQSVLSFSSQAGNAVNEMASENKDKDVDMEDITGNGPVTPKKSPAVRSLPSAPGAPKVDSDDEIKSESAKSESMSPSAGRLKRQKDSATDESEGNESEPVTKRRRGSRKSKTNGPAPKPVTGNKGKRGSSRTTDKVGIAANKSSKQPEPAVAEAESSASDGEDLLSGSSSEELDVKPKEEEKKRNAASKQRQKVQVTLKSNGKDPYPDWKAGDPVPYAALCTTFSLVEMTTKRLAILAHCSLFLRQVLRLTPGDLLPTIQLMINKLAADYAGIELGIGESLIMKAIGESTGRSLAVIKTDQHEIGDLGLVAAKSRSNQPTMFKPKPLTVRGVHESLLAIAKVQGHGSQDKKIGGIKKLLSSADAGTAGKIDITKDKGGPSEAKYIVRFLEGKLRLGLAERTVLVALAHAMVSHEIEVKNGKAPSTEQLAKGEAILKQVYSELPSYEVIIPAMLEHGLFNVQDKCKLQPGVPLKPMLAKPTKSISEVLDRFEGKDFTCEYKYDGERAQIHYVSRDSIKDYAATAGTLQKDGQGLCAIFSRNSEDLSKKYPDVLDKLESWVKPGTKSFVVDCETVAWDLENKKVLPFQQLMTRKRKDVKAEDIKVRVCVFAFDILFLNGEPTVKMTLRERRSLLHETFIPTEGEFAFAQYGNTSNVEEIQNLLDESVKSSCEGLMVKMLDTDESGYEPSKRSRNWLKVKKDYLAGIGDSLDLVVIGAYFGKGKRTSVYGAFLLAAYNPNTENYETICNIGTGFSESLLEELHKTLSPLSISQPKPFYSHSSVPKDQPDVWFEPRLVWEVKAADLTISPRYRCASDEVMGMTGTGADGKGVSLRFPRYIKSRDDKKPDQASTTRMVAEMYRKQESVTKDDKGKKAADDDWEY